LALFHTEVVSLPVDGQVTISVDWPFMTDWLDGLKSGRYTPCYCLHSSVESN